MAKKKAKMPSETVRLKRIEDNYKKLPKKHRANLRNSTKGGEVIKQATSTAGGFAANRPQDRIRRG